MMLEMSMGKYMLTLNTTDEVDNDTVVVRSAVITPVVEAVVKGDGGIVAGDNVT